MHISNKYLINYTKKKLWKIYFSSFFINKTLHKINFNNFTVFYKRCWLLIVNTKENKSTHLFWFSSWFFLFTCFNFFVFFTYFFILGIYFFVIWRFFNFTNLLILQPDINLTKLTFFRASKWKNYIYFLQITTFKLVFLYFSVKKLYY